MSVNEILKVNAGMDAEEVYFQKQEQEKIKALRDEAAEDADLKYREAHSGHCFRCGTTSLVEVVYGKVHVDICVNEDCGAVHLDPGELEAIAENTKHLGSVRKAIMGIFR